MKGKVIILGKRVAIIPWSKLRAQKIRIYKTACIACIDKECRPVWSVVSWDDIPKVDELFNEAEAEGRIYKACNCIVKDNDYEDLDSSRKYRYLMFGEGMI